MNTAQLRPPSHEQSTSGHGSSVRPRNRRPISTELLSQGDAQSRSSSSRGVSPIPSRYPSRIASADRAGNNSTGRPMGGLVVPNTNQRRGASSPVLGGFGKTGKGLWEGGWSGSWTTLQGIASSVLGGDLSDGAEVGSGRKGDAATKRARGNSMSKTQPPSSWGPSGNSPAKKVDSIGTGTLAARDLALKAKKTASVLESHEHVNGGLDVSGRFKRRTSLDEPSYQEEEPAALVYIHEVQKSDTLAGVMLRYNCQPAVFRKANRLWPNDSIQIRKTVFLPVDACSVKGRPCEAPQDGQGVDLLAPTPNIEESPAYTNGSFGKSSTGREGLSPFPSFDARNAESAKCEDEEPWTHVRWVLIDSNPNSRPVQIARLPRKTLGYFPPRRRKSQATLSSVSSPRGSFDVPPVPSSLPNTFSNSPVGSPSRRFSNLSARPVTGSYFPAATSHPSSRRDSVSDGGGTRVGWMQGPGGVGTLDKNVRKPGPARDGLNNWAAKHLPSLATDHLQSSSILVAETATFGFRKDELGTIGENGAGFIGMSGVGSGSGTSTPNREGLGLEQAAAAIEGWVRRLAIKGPSTPKLGPGGRPLSDAGDLIELLDGAGSDDGRSFEVGSVPVQSIGSAAVGSSREDGMSTLRGRLAGGKQGKSD